MMKIFIGPRGIAMDRILVSLIYQAKVIPLRRVLACCCLHHHIS